MSLIRAPAGQDIWDVLARIFSALNVAWERHQKEQERLGAIWENLVDRAVDLAASGGGTPEEILSRAKAYARQIASERGLTLPPDFEERLRVRASLVSPRGPDPNVVRVVDQIVSEVVKSSGATEEAKARARNLVTQQLQALGLPQSGVDQVFEARWSFHSQLTPTPKSVADWVSGEPWARYLPPAVASRRVQDRETAYDLAVSWLTSRAKELQQAIKSGAATSSMLEEYKAISSYIGGPKVVETEVKVPTFREEPLTPGTPAYRVAREYGVPTTYLSPEEQRVTVSTLEGTPGETLRDRLVSSKQDVALRIIAQKNPRLLDVPLLTPEVERRVLAEFERIIRSYYREPVPLGQALRELAASGTGPEATAAVKVLSSGLIDLDVRVAREDVPVIARILAERIAEREKRTKEGSQLLDRFLGALSGLADNLVKLEATQGPEAARRAIISLMRRFGVHESDPEAWALVDSILSAHRGTLRYTEQREEKKKFESEFKSREEKATKARSEAVRAFSGATQFLSGSAAVLDQFRQRLEGAVSRLASQIQSARAQKKEPNAQLVEMHRIMGEALSRVNNGDVKGAYELVSSLVSGGISEKLVVSMTGLTSEFLKKVGSAANASEKWRSTLGDRLFQYLQSISPGADEGNLSLRADFAARVFMSSPQVVAETFLKSSGGDRKKALEDFRRFLGVFPFVTTINPSWVKEVEEILQGPPRRR